MTFQEIIARTSSRKIEFSAEEITRAEIEMRKTKLPISTVCRDGVFIGLTDNRVGMQYFSAYAKGFFLSVLEVKPNGAGVLCGISIPGFLLETIGTEHEDKARGFAFKYSERVIAASLNGRRVGERTLLLDDQIENFRVRIAA